MVLNNFDSEFKSLQKMSGKTQQELADEVGILRESVARVAKGNVIAQKFTQVYEAMGYDIKIVYIKRGDK